MMIQEFRFLSSMRESSLQGDAVVRSVLKVSAWQGSEEQPSKKFAWPLRRRANQYCLFRRSLTHVSSPWSGYSHDKPQESSFRPPHTAGTWIASPINEAGQ